MLTATITGHESIALRRAATRDAGEAPREAGTYDLLDELAELALAASAAAGRQRRRAARPA